MSRTGAICEYGDGVPARLRCRDDHPGSWRHLRTGAHRSGRRLHRLHPADGSCRAQRWAHPLQAAREADLGVFGEFSDSERLVANLHRAYAEIDGLPPGCDLDIGPAIADMIAWNDGKPIRCFV